MSSQLDLDQGGTRRQWNKVFLGPGVGWVDYPVKNELVITSPGTYIIQFGTNFVAINVAGSVTIILPTVLGSTGGVHAQPGKYLSYPITIVDIGGHAGTNPVTIQPASGSENILGLPQVRLTTPYSSFCLRPDIDQFGYTESSL